MTKQLTYPSTLMRQAQKDESIDSVLRNGFWLYLLLVLLDGALRKWILPGLSSPLLIVRDLLAVVICLYALSKGKFQWNVFVIITWAVMIFSAIYTVTLAHGNLFIAFYGARIYLFHFPLIFIFGQVLRPEDVNQFRKFMLWFALPTIALLLLQYNSPQTSVWNRGIGGDMAGSGFTGALGKYRPSSWFSFTSGNVEHLSLTACLIMSGWLSRQSINKILLSLATLTIVIAAPLSISRGYIVQLAITILFATLVGVSSAKQVKSFIVMFAAVLVLYVGLSQLPFFQDSIEVITTRFERASVAEGGIQNTVVGRVFGEKLNTFDPSRKPNFFGVGLGATTNFGALVLSGSIQFLYSEDEWGRTTDELGILLGGVIILIRLSITFMLLFEGWQRSRRGDSTAWVLMSFGMVLLINAQLSAPTTLGFFTVTVALVVASVKPESREWLAA